MQNKFLITGWDLDDNKLTRPGQQQQKSAYTIQQMQQILEWLDFAMQRSIGCIAVLTCCFPYVNSYSLIN